VTRYEVTNITAQRGAGLNGAADIAINRLREHAHVRHKKAQKLPKDEQPIYRATGCQESMGVGNELVHAGSHARPQAVDRGIPSQGVSTE